MTRHADNVRDHREPGHFWADNEVIDDYLPEIGIHGFAVYMILTRHADTHTGRCSPSVDSIAKRLHVSAPTVRKALDTLKAHNLIRYRQRTKEVDGKTVFTSNEYTLLRVPKRNSDTPTKGDLVPNDVDQGTKGDLVGYSTTLTRVLKDVDQGTKGRLQEQDSSNKTHLTRDSADASASHTPTEKKSRKSTKQQPLPLDQGEETPASNSRPEPLTPISAAPPFPAPKLSTQLMNAYVDTVTGKGYQTSRRDAKQHIDDLISLAATPDEVATAIEWAVKGWTEAYAYPLSRVPDAVRTLRAKQAQAGAKKSSAPAGEAEDERERRFAERAMNQKVNYRVRSA